MPDLKCPHCRSALRVPDSLMGKKLRCKNESCRQTFVAQVQSASPAVQVDDPPMFSDMPPDWQQAMDDRKREEQRPDELDNRARFEFGDGPASNDDLSDSRYPNLERYLGWGKLATKTILILSYVGICFGFLGGILSVINSFYSPLEMLGAGVGLLFVTLFFVALAYLYYVFVMAGLEFVQVIIDIEENTRSRREASL